MAETQILQVLPSAGAPVTAGTSATVQFIVPKGTYSCESKLLLKFGLPAATYTNAQRIWIRNDCLFACRGLNTTVSVDGIVRVQSLQGLFVEQLAWFQKNKTPTPSDLVNPSGNVAGNGQNSETIQSYIALGLGDAAAKTYGYQVSLRQLFPYMFLPDQAVFSVKQQMTIQLGLNTVGCLIAQTIATGVVATINASIDPSLLMKKMVGMDNYTDEMIAYSVQQQYLGTGSVSVVHNFTVPPEQISPRAVIAYVIQGAGQMNFDGIPDAQDDITIQAQKNGYNFSLNDTSAATSRACFGAVSEKKNGYDFNNLIAEDEKTYSGVQVQYQGNKAGTAATDCFITYQVVARNPNM